MSVKEEKDKLRKKIKMLSDSFTKDYLAASDQKIYATVTENERYKAAKTIFVYVSVGIEPDTLKIIQSALESGKKVLVPKCKKKPFMKAVEIRSPEELKPAAFGLLEPENDKGYEGTIDVALVPCICASENGKRLGHGGGFYDRFLRNREMYKICLCRGRSLMKDLPYEISDVLMDEVISERSDDII